MIIMGCKSTKKHWLFQTWTSRYKPKKRKEIYSLWMHDWTNYNRNYL